MQITFSVEAGHRFYGNDSLFLIVQFDVDPKGNNKQAK
jgi:hypothetical protein